MITLAARKGTLFKMKALFTFFFCWVYADCTFAQSDTILINGSKFLTVKQTINTDYSLKDSIVKLYRLKNGKRQFVLKHYLRRYGADAENEFEDVGNIQFIKDSIILSTLFLQKGFDPIPERSKRIYRITSNGKLLLLFNKCKFKNSKKWVTCPDNY